MRGVVDLESEVALEHRVPRILKVVLLTSRRRPVRHER